MEDYGADALAEGGNSGGSGKRKILLVLFGILVLGVKLAMVFGNFLIYQKK